MLQSGQKERKLMGTEKSLPTLIGLWPGLSPAEREEAQTTHMP